jgi:hypothetical protein
LPQQRSGLEAAERWPLLQQCRWIVPDILVPFAATRLMLAIVGCVAVISLPDVPLPAAAWELNEAGDRADIVTRLSPTTYPMHNIWIRWDAAWYHDIAKNGYSFQPGEQSNTAFFPMYPLLMKAVYPLLPRGRDVGWFRAGFIVSNAALLVGLFYLFLLVRIDFDHRTAARTVLYLLVFPTTLFLSAVYSESVFLAVSVAAFYHARRSQWLLAALFAAAATITRSAGILLAAPLLLEYLAQRRFEWREIRPDIAVLLLIPVPLLLHMLYLKQRVGNVMAISDAQAAWGGAWGKLTSPADARDQVDERTIDGSECDESGVRRSGTRRRAFCGCAPPLVVWLLCRGLFLLRHSLGHFRFRAAVRPRDLSHLHRAGALGQEPRVPPGLHLDRERARGVANGPIRVVAMGGVNSGVNDEATDFA